jgi:hypothetical protein
MRKGKLRLLYALFTTLAYGGLFAPITTLLIMNRDVYFIKNESSLSVSLGGILVLLTIVLLMKYGVKKIKPIFWAGILFVITYCLDSIIKDLVSITFFVLIGVSIFTIFQMPMNHFKRLLNSYTDEQVRTYARETTIEQSFGGRC